MMDPGEVQDRLRRTFDAVAATTQVDAAPARRTRRARRPLASAIVPLGALLAAAVTVASVLMFTHNRGGSGVELVRIAPVNPAGSETVPGLKAIPGMLAVAAENGVPAGYVRKSDVDIPPEEYREHV